MLKHKVYFTGFMSVLLLAFIAVCGGENNVVYAAVAPPTVVYTSPASAATGASIIEGVTANFSEAMRPLTLNSKTFTLKQGTTPVPGIVSYTGETAMFRPLRKLAPSTTYTATITTGAKGRADNALASDFSWSFTTAILDTVRPTVSSVMPMNAAAGVATNTEITATFSEAMYPGNLNAPLRAFLRIHGNSLVPGKVSYADTTAVFSPIRSLAPNAKYTAIIRSTAMDLSGNRLARSFVWSFRTGATTDTTAPLVISTFPANADTGVAVNTNITASFSEAMRNLTITQATFTLLQGVTPIPGTVSYIGTTAVFNPTSNLAPSTVYTATVTTGATDLAGNALASNFVWNFTTGLAADITAPTVTLVNPVDSATGVARGHTVNATFSKAMAPLTITTANFKLTDGATPVVGTVTYDAMQNVATFTPLGKLASNTLYTATVTTSVKDLAGNALASDKIWSFTTGAAIVIGQAPINLGTASTFAIIATDSIGGVAGNNIYGNVGLSPGALSSITIAPSEIHGNIYTATNPIVKAAQASLLVAYKDATSRSLNAISLPTNLTGLTLYPGLYVNASSTGITTGTVYLDAQGDPNAVFIFKTPALTTGTSTSVVLSGGAQAKNVYWQVFSSATLGVTSIFKGTVLADISVSVLNGAVVEGRLFAGSGPGGAGSVVVNTCIVTIPAQ